MNQTIRALQLAVKQAVADERNSAAMIYEVFLETVKQEKTTADAVAEKTRAALQLLEKPSIPDFLSSPPAPAFSNIGEVPYDSDIPFNYGAAQPVGGDYIFGGGGIDTITFDVNSSSK